MMEMRVDGKVLSRPVILVLPVDHWVPDHAAFRAAVSIGLTAARHGRFVLFGLRPTAPATRFGYIRMGDGLASFPDVRDVANFVEKPDLVMVERFLACNEHLWNSGIFLLPARVFIDELETLAPDVLAACRQSLAGARHDLDFLRLEEHAFETCPSISIDYAIMEKTERAVVVAAAFDWSDIGSWSALWTRGIPQASQKRSLAGYLRVQLGQTIWSESVTAPPALPPAPLGHR